MIWDHELPKELEYNQDKPFFHTWQADVGIDRSTSGVSAALTTGRTARSHLCLRLKARLRPFTKRSLTGRGMRVSVVPMPICMLSLLCHAHDPSQIQGGEEGEGEQGHADQEEERGVPQVTHLGTCTYFVEAALRGC